MFFIAYGWRFVKSHHYTGSIDGEALKIFIQDHFPSMLKNAPKPKCKISL